eukprot:365085-Chlamydomonas_euryale.AAC.8
MFHACAVQCMGPPAVSSHTHLCMEGCSCATCAACVYPAACRHRIARTSQEGMANNSWCKCGSGQPPEAASQHKARQRGGYNKREEPDDGGNRVGSSSHACTASDMPHPRPVLAAR